MYICSSCGYQTAKWLGKCPGCEAWGTLEETLIEAEKSIAKAARAQKSGTSVRRAVKISEVSTADEVRWSTGMSELDRVLGGGIVRGSLVLVGGDPGIGKSTILLQICKNVGAEKKVLYVSGEESERQLKMRAERLGAASDNIYIISENDVETILECINELSPDMVIIDSIQTMHRDDIASASGSVPQVREATNAFMRMAKSRDIAMFIVGHVTKDGSLAGPRVLEHMVDCVLYFEGDRQLSFRILRAVKNRFGSTNEIGVFEMRNDGLAEVENPSAMLLAGRNINNSGSAVISTVEGSRGVLAEVQALVTPTGFGNPRRTAAGFDLNRLFLMLAVLEKRGGVKLNNQDVYINVAGGLRLDETAVDLGVCAAIVTALVDIAIPDDMIFIGEVGLGGELRAVSQLEKRIFEAAKMGFTKAIVPHSSLKGIKPPKTIKLIGAKTVSEAISELRKAINQSDS